MTDAADLSHLIEIRLNRRTLLGGAGAIAALPLIPAMANAAGSAPLTPAAFTEISHGVDETHHVAPGHDAQVLLRWGDPILPGAPDFDPMAQTAAAQAGQFGYNNDYVGYIPLGRDRALLCVNHEYSIGHLMFPNVGVTAEGSTNLSAMTANLCAIEQAATGASIVEIQRTAGQWQLVRNSRYNRRITTSGTIFEISGPVRSSSRLATSADPKAERITGTMGNCAGGITPWGTYLSSEENIDEYFGGTLAEGHREARNHKAMGVPGKQFIWSAFEKRFDIGQEPNEPNRFGWVVEIDALDPSAPPKKRTALGRFKHEGAETVIAPDGRLVIYMGDDERFQFLYRFVSRDRVNLKDRKANRDLLDHGTLSVARFDADGHLLWLPLIFGQGPLTSQNGFESQADVLIEARHAAKLLGATPMDRPEDVQPHPKNGSVYVMLTNNNKRTAEKTDKANPRADNVSGHIVELKAPGGDHGADHFDWDILVLCGAPDKGGSWNSKTSADGWFVCPDNCVIDPSGRLWVATDQGSKWSASGTADGIWALGTDGETRARGQMFFRVPVGAEMCGPCFALDGRTFFVAVQHPGADGTKDYAPFARASTFGDPATRWPDFNPKMPPRPSLVAIRRKDGGVIGG